jgi:hypothetical protein
VPNEGLVRRLDARDGLDVALGDDEQVDRRLRIEILEGEHLFVLKFDLGRAFSATMRQNTQPGVTFPSRSCILAWLTVGSRDQSLKESVMGTCPKCKLRIRKNGNHVKLGSIWYHKMCPAKPARTAK